MWLSDQFCPSLCVSRKNISENSDYVVVLTFSKHIKQLTIICIRTYAYLAEANALHSIHNSSAFLLSV